VNAYVGGGEGVACQTDAIQADGVLSFLDDEGKALTSIPITVERYAGQPIYQVHAQISPISAFSSELTDLSGVSDTAIRGLVHWGLEGESLRATFEYTGQTNRPGGGMVFIVSVAAFSQDG
jgi:hypothetical protein